MIASNKTIVTMISDMVRIMRIHSGLRDFFFFLFLLVTEVRLAGVNLFVAIPVQVKHKKINLPQEYVSYDASG
ncbi:hypothetical protein ACRQ5D_31625 [Mucilaginibacter sp. P25]|uniref:hypothetical protein n=1 Tax=Mucilaginibacter TaxID=423349 RepID=UPI00115FE6EF|nr:MULTISPECIES: hypothetical protein [Mucilaginibacter]UOE52192.1 hypothetical protein MTO98_13995 [Mucilaginibacter sp. SMC90]